MSDSESLFSAEVSPVDAPLQRDVSFLPELLQASRLIRVNEARERFDVRGAGVTVAVLDTGLRTTHLDFAGRVVSPKNFTTDNGGRPDDASDGQGHGTNVAGIICAGDIHLGMAPEARIIPIKVLNNAGGGSFEAVSDALQWVIDHREAHGVSAVCMSLGDSGNHQSDSQLTHDKVARRLRLLREAGVVCCVAAGNDYFVHHSVQGMGYPAIVRESVSVGAVYDEDAGGFSYESGAKATSTGPDRITPFSQRLHEKVSQTCRTDIFAPGAPITSSGILTDEGESVQHGTSQATPVVAGVALLIQSYHLRATGRLPSVDEVVGWMIAGSVAIKDGDDEQDNVLHTGLTFRRLDALGALTACAQGLAKEALLASGVLKR